LADFGGVDGGLGARAVVVVFSVAGGGGGVAIGAWEVLAVVAVVVVVVVVVVSLSFADSGAWPVSVSSWALCSVLDSSSFPLSSEGAMALGIDDQGLPRTLRERTATAAAAATAQTDVPQSVVEDGFVMNIIYGNSLEKKKEPNKPSDFKSYGVSVPLSGSWMCTMIGLSIPGSMEGWTDRLFTPIPIDECNYTDRLTTRGRKEAVSFSYYIFSYIIFGVPVVSSSCGDEKRKRRARVGVPIA
jgi:hypothetical protein